MTKTYLINYFENKIDIKKKNKYIFRNEYLLKSYPGNLSKLPNCSYLENLGTVFYKNKKVDFIKKKTMKYRNFLKKHLNKIHDIKFTKKEWGILLDYYLIFSIISILRKIDTYKKIKDKKVFIEVVNSDFFFLDTSSVINELAHGKKLNKYIDYVIFNKFNFKNLKIKKTHFRNSDSKKKQTNLFKVYILKILIKLFKSNLIFDGYFGLYNSIKIMILTRFKILFLNENFFESLKKTNTKNLDLRNKINIPVEDNFDYIFNEYNKNIFPSSFLENFKNYEQLNEKISNNKINIGTAILLHISDTFKFFALKIRRNGGKIFSFQHGGLFRMRKFSPEDFIIKNYSDREFVWHDKNGIGAPYFPKNKEYTKNKRKNILLFPSQTLFNELTENLKKCNHLYLNKYWKFYEIIDSEKKKCTKIKLINDSNSIIFKKAWLKKIKDKGQFIEESYKGDIFKNYKITVIDNFSTPLFELIYLSEPFIIINDSKNLEFNEEFKKILNLLKDLNILFSSEKKAADFINKNYYDIENWWAKIIKKKKFKLVRDKLFPIKEFNHLKFTNIILKNEILRGK